MDPQVQASFIPKKPLDQGGRSGGGAGLFFILSLLIFVASIVAAGAAFAYQQYLGKQISDKSSQLTLAEGAYDPSVINELMRLDSRINQAQVLLGKHIAASGIFNFLQMQTLQNVSFTSFDYQLQNDGGAKISLQGDADNFSTVALQSDQFGNSKVLKDVVFSGITVGADGRVTFKVDATVDPALINYANSLSSNPGVVQNPAPTTPAASSTTQ